MVLEYQRLLRLDPEWSYVHVLFFCFICEYRSLIILALWEGYRVEIYLSKMLRQENYLSACGLSRQCHATTRLARLNIKRRSPHERINRYRFTPPGEALATVARAFDWASWR